MFQLKKDKIYESPLYGMAEIRCDYMKRQDYVQFLRNIEIGSEMKKMKPICLIYLLNGFADKFETMLTIWDIACQRSSEKHGKYPRLRMKANLPYERRLDYLTFRVKNDSLELEDEMFKVSYNLESDYVSVAVKDSVVLVYTESVRIGKFDASSVLDEYENFMHTAKDDDGMTMYDDITSIVFSYMSNVEMLPEWKQKDMDISVIVYNPKEVTFAHKYTGRVCATKDLPEFSGTAFFEKVQEAIQNRK